VDDLQPLLDEELSRLPDGYRAVVILCDLEGRTRAEAARHLGVPEGTVGSRLARARALLARRLAGRGVALSGGALAAVLSRTVASAGVPDAMAASTITTATLFAAGHATTAGAVSVRVAALTEGVLKAMLVSKLKAVVAVVLLLGVVVVTAAASGQRPLVTPGEVPAEQRVPDLSGTWTGDEWGTVVLQQTKDGGFDGTYTDTFGKDVGRISVRWTPASRRFEGTWSEGRFRFGHIALEAAGGGGAITGAYTTDPNCTINPGVPSLASLRWRKAKPGAAHGDDPPAAGDRKEDRTAWGQEVDGLQAGLVLKDARTYRHGEVIKLEVRLRNVGKAAVKVAHGLLRESPPAVTEPGGGRVTVAMPLPKGYKVRVTELVVKPGETITLYNPVVGVESAEVLRLSGLLLVETPTMYAAPGKYRVAFGGMLQSHPTLSTGTVEVEVREPVEAFTAWGKVLGGLQAGLGYKPGEKRAHHHGETVTLVVRVRNVGTEVVKFQYLRKFLIETPPTVTNGQGKSIPREGVTTFGIHIPEEVNLAPGKEIELHELKLNLRPPRENGNERVAFESLEGTGKFQIQYERVLGNSSEGTIKIDPALSKLATGKLELDITPTPPAAAGMK
jgi:hypothetical protein